MPKQYTYQDTQRPDGCYITFERVQLIDDDADAKEYLFQDEDAREEDQARLDAWYRQEWHFMGIRAVAHIFTVKNRTGKHSTLESAGLWAIESDSDPSYLEEVYQDEVRELKREIEMLQNPIYED